MSASFRRIERRPRAPPGQPPPASIGSTVGTVTASAAAPLRAPGTRPWVNGQSLVSSGNRDLDVVLGGGLCLGTLTLLEEDRFSDHALCLARYFVAQGVSTGQRTLVIGAEGRAALQASMVEQLPFDLTHKKHTAATAAATEAAHAAASASPSALAALPTIEEGGDDNPPSTPGASEAEAGAGAGAGPALSIAWQYQKYMDGGDASSSNSSSGGGGASVSSASASASFCHSYDLSRPMQPELRLAEARLPNVLDVGDVDTDASAASGSGGGSEGQSQYARVYGAVERAVKALPPRTVLRVLVKSLLDRRGAWDGAGWRQGLHLLHSLRALAATAPVVVLVTMPSHHLESEHRRRLFARVADTVLEVDSFAGKRHRTPPEFEAFAGILYIKALQHPHALAPARGPSNKMGIKRDRRKLHIEPLHLPPEGVRALTEDVEKGKKKKGHASSAAAMLCATSGGAAGGGGLDF